MAHRTGALYWLPGIALALLLVLAVTGCAGPTQTARTTPAAGRCGFGGCGQSFQAKLTAQVSTPQGESACGDGICQQVEDTHTCPQDCSQPSGCARKRR